MCSGWSGTLNSEVPAVGQGKFDLRDLGLLSGPAEREYDIITRNAGIMLQASAAVFCALDVNRASVFLRSHHLTRECNLLPDALDQSTSLFASAIESGQSMRIVDLDAHAEFAANIEPAKLPFKGLLSEIVHGPAGEPIGALIALSNVPRKWAELERLELQDHALLLSRHVLLRATLKTIKCISQERDKAVPIPRFHN